jgi:hypothetical protein
MNLYSEQSKLREQHENNDTVDFDPETLDGLQYIAGVDLSFPLGDHENAIACLVVMAMPNLEVIVAKGIAGNTFLNECSLNRSFINNSFTPNFICLTSRVIWHFEKWILYLSYFNS